MPRPRLHFDVSARYVTVYCAAPSHADTPWVIETFIPSLHAGNAWMRSSHQYLHGEFVRVAAEREDVTRTLVDHPGGATTVINTGTVEGRHQMVEADQRQQFRTSVTLRCDRCGDAVRRTGENLQSDLNRLDAHGLRDVTLVALRLAMR